MLKKQEEEEERRREREEAEYDAAMQELDRRVQADVPLTPAESGAWRKWAGHFSMPTRRQRKKKKLPRGCTRLQCAYAKVTGSHFASSSCTSGAFAAALSPSVVVIAEYWNDYTGGVMSSAACGSSGARYQVHCVGNWLPQHSANSVHCRNLVDIVADCHRVHDLTSSVECFSCPGFRRR